MKSKITGIFLLFSLIGISALTAQQKRNVFDDVDFLIEPVKSINTIASDISPVFVKGQLFFSGVPEEFFNKTRLERKNKAFYNVYAVKLDEDGYVVSSRSLVPGFGAAFHEGPVAYCEQTGELFTTLSNTINSDTIQKLLPVEKIRLRLVIKKFIDGSWKTTAELPFNDDRYHFAHPAISVTGDTLVFSSDLAGDNRGNNDLFMSVRNQGEWSNPINLGDSINTPGNEMFPVFINGRTLSFASNARRGGYGGFDIYYTTFPVTGKIENLGDKINTHMDDFGLVIHKTGNVGYFTSDRGAAGSDDIFRVDIRKLYRELNGIVVNDRTNQPIGDARVNLFNCDGKLIHSILSKADGSFHFEVFKTGCQHLEGIKEDHQNGYADGTGLNYVELRLKQNQVYEIIVLDVDDGAPLEGAVISCNGNFNRVTDQHGMITFLPPFPFECYFSIKKENYLDQSLLPDSSRFTGSVIRDTVWMFKKELNKTFVLDNIYYDFDKWDILPASETELNKLVKIMKDNPELKVELGSHTDSRGSGNYNQRLSQKRSESAVKYIVRHDVDEERITAKGYGESQLINHCSDGVPCTEEEHRQNRRTEFKILSF